MATLEQYRNLLRIDKLRLDDELEIQAEMQERIGAEVARLNTRMIEAKDELTCTEARLIEEFKDGSTVAVADAKAKRHPDRRRAWEKYQAQREVHELWANLQSAWITKGYKLADLGQLFGSDYFAIKSISRPDGERRREVSGVDEESRTALRRASEQVAEPARGRNRI